VGLRRGGINQERDTAGRYAAELTPKVREERRIHVELVSKLNLIRSSSPAGAHDARSDSTPGTYNYNQTRGENRIGVENDVVYTLHKLMRALYAGGGVNLGARGLGLR
jgi:hypothetical protein